MESPYAQIRIFARKKDEGNFQQVAYVNCKLEFVCLFDVMICIW